jgi:hypothetical protein
VQAQRRTVVPAAQAARDGGVQRRLGGQRGGAQGLVARLDRGLLGEGEVRARRARTVGVKGQPARQRRGLRGQPGQPGASGRGQAAVKAPGETVEVGGHGGRQCRGTLVVIGRRIGACDVGEGVQHGVVGRGWGYRDVQ